MEDTTSTAIEILNHGHQLKDRNLGRDCSWCSYKSICQAELMGLDVDYIIKADYEIKEKRDQDGNKKEKETRSKRKKSHRR